MILLFQEKKSYKIIKIHFCNIRHNHSAPNQQNTKSKLCTVQKKSRAAKVRAGRSRDARLSRVYIHACYIRMCVCVCQGRARGKKAPLPEAGKESTHRPININLLKWRRGRTLSCAAVMLLQPCGY